ncbi:MAG: carboxylesterase family protein [Bacteroidetes bacterium]|nr:carboxylesterase family protein [Bacteroidota bacterium]
MKRYALFPAVLLVLAGIADAQTAVPNAQAPRVTTANGVVEGVKETSGILSFKGVPFGAPPVGDLRWKEPQPVKSWSGVKKCDHFGPQAMQPRIYSDMIFRSAGVSEDCLYLNIWVPGGDAKDLPVLVYFYGGGYMAGDGSEPRYDGESMAKQGIVAITVNYRLGVFGFLAHPELTKESPHHASGNYGLMDQAAALDWVHRNVRAFGGDPSRVTIAGESAGSFSVSAQMASPLSKDLIAGAIGESGSLLGSAMKPLAEAEKEGEAFMRSCGASTLGELRAMPAEKVQEAAKKYSNYRFPVVVDGYFFPKPPVDIFLAGEQAHVPLLVGWNFEEGSYRSITGEDRPSRESYENGVRKMYGAAADTVLRLYAAASDQEVEEAGTDLASDKFIAYGTWRWSDIQARTGGKPVYRYLFGSLRPSSKPARRPSHSAEIEYALGNLPLNTVYAWTSGDYAVSATMQGYFVNFIRSGNPNGKGVKGGSLAQWPAVKAGGPAAVMNIGAPTGAKAEQHRERYLFWQGRGGI